MIKREELYRTPEYWLETIQNDIFRKVYEYMEENDLNKSALAKKLGFSRAYITQVLNGEFNFSIKKLIELSLAIDKVPLVEFEEVEDFIADKEKELDKMRGGMSISFNINDMETIYMDSGKMVESQGDVA